MRVLLGLCLLAASVLAVANAAPSVGGAARLQRKELMNRLQTKLEAFKKNVKRQGGKTEESGQPANDAPADDVPGDTDEPSVDPAYAMAIVYILDLNERLTILDYALNKLWEAYGGTTDYEKIEGRRRGFAGFEGVLNGPQQVIIRREMLNILTEIEYDLVALELLPIDFSNEVAPTDPTPTEPPTEPTPSESPNDDDVPQDDEKVAAEKRIAGKHGQFLHLPVASPAKAVLKKTRAGSKPIEERAAALTQQLKKYLDRRLQ